MIGLLVLKEKLRNYYNTHELFLRPIIKFLAVFIGLMLIKVKVGYMEILSSVPVLFLIAVLAAFLPWGFIVVIMSGIIVINLYALSVELSIVVLATMLIMFLLFFRFAPKDSVLLILVPIAFFLKVPYVVPIAVGLICTPISIVSVTFGTIIYFMLSVITTNSTAIDTIAADRTATAGVTTIINMILGNKEMILTIVVFAIVISIVYIIKRMSINNAWMTAIIVGSLANFILLLVGNLLLVTESSIVWLIVGTVLSVFLAYILQFFVFSVDYTRTEHTQFEDDDYYYYVKAVPKINVAEPEMNVKRINAQRRKNSQKNKR